MNAMRMLLLLCVGAAVVGLLLAGMAAGGDSEGRAAAPRSAKDDGANKRQAMVAAGVMVLREQMKDPESFVLRRATAMASGFGCIDYRGKNAYGAMFPGWAVVRPDGAVLVQERDGAKFTKTFNAECVGHSGDELADFINAKLLAR